MDAAEAKAKASQLFLDIYRADRRLIGVVAEDQAAPLVDAAVTFDIMNAKVVVQGAQLFEALLARRAPVEPLLQALLVLEPRASRIGVAVRQPNDVLRLSPVQRSELVKTAPPSHSDFLDELEKKAVPEVIKDARKAGNMQRFVGAGLVLLAAGLVVVAFTGLPKNRLKEVQLALPADGIPCKTLRTASTFLFCVVDEAPLAALDDDAIRARIKLTQEAAHKSGFKSVNFLKPVGPDGDQHRYKPFLWERDPDHGKPALDPGLKQAPAPASAPPAPTPTTPQ